MAGLSGDRLIEEHERIRQIKEAAEGELFRIPGVQGVAVSYKRVGGEQTEVLGITVMVEEKRPEANLPRDQLIPRTIQGIPTDVIQGTITPRAADTATYNPLVGGIRIARCEGDQAGTLGLIVVDANTRAPMLLSNYHVLCCGNWHPGDQIGQPAPSDSWSGTCAVVGAISRFRMGGHFVAATNTTYGVDCAVAALANAARGATISSIAAIGAVAGWRWLTPADLYNPALPANTVLRKRGQMSGLTQGYVTSITGNSQNGSFTLANQIWVSAVGGVPVMASGDSGSVLVDGNNRVVGLLWGSDAPGTLATGNPIGAVLDALNVTIL